MLIVYDPAFFCVKPFRGLTKPLMDEANKLEIHEKHFVRPRLTRCYDSYFHYVCTNITKRYTILQVLPETVVRNTVFIGNTKLP